MVESLTLLGIGAALVFTAINVYLLVQIFRKQRTFVGFTKASWGWVIFMLYFLSLYTICFYYLPITILEAASSGITLDASFSSIYNALLAWYISGLLLISIFVIQFTFTKQNDRSFFAISVLGIFSGFSESIVIMIIHQATGSMDHILNWLPYFVFAITLSVTSIKITQSKLIKMTYDIVYEKRVDFIEKILRAQYHNFENIEQGNIEACLNNDTEKISMFAQAFVTILTSSMTIIGSFVYIGIINPLALLLSVIVIIIAATLFFVTSMKVSKFWERNRDIQNHFFKFIQHLIGGFKELRLNKVKNKAFKQDMIQTTQDYITTRMIGEKKFVNVNVMGEILIYLVLGMALFIFPLVVDGLTGQNLTALVLVFIFISGHITMLLGHIPQLTDIKISWDRINKTLLELDALQDTDEESSSNSSELRPDSITLQLNNVTYQYKQESNHPFKVGPIDFEFKSGEITFITGGNGSGKSTLAKLITGLYIPDEGEIILNGKLISHDHLGNYFSTVFSDFHLFDKLYGLDHDKLQNQLETYLNILQLKGKVSIEDGAFSTTQLSTGQRKRLALLVNYLEDSPIFLFDEWAADQDPQFRQFFYQTLLPDLKARGKCVIAITHDDHYFAAADHRIHMEMGQMTIKTHDSTEQQSFYSSSEKAN